MYKIIENEFNSYKGGKRIIGKSLLGRNIFAFHVGEENCPQFISTYAIHGRERVTALLALAHIRMGVKGGGWIIPLVNPDGAEICDSEPLWKANARGVDLNCNFDADWGKGDKNILVRGAENCIGDSPFSEPETRALADFTVEISPYATFSFHTKGGEIYWEYGGRGNELGARILSEATGYPYKKITGSCGGYKDWCLTKLGIPSYTIECGSDDLTHPINRLEDIKECFSALARFTEFYEK